ncbi:MAG: NAD-glutamate dehydrogenase [Simkaniaceae bacterium]|nr:NAD-glutamate dehydrogenase [Simkaniaceae bacterium]
MKDSRKLGRLSKEELQNAIHLESKEFKKYYLWIEKHMPQSFFEEAEQNHVMLIAHNLMGFEEQDHFAHLHLKGCSIALCLDSPDVDLRILRHYNLYGIKNYRTFISDTPPPFPGLKSKLRIAIIYFTVLSENKICEVPTEILPSDQCKRLFQLSRDRNPSLTEPAFNKLLCSMNSRFLHSLTEERLVLALDMFCRAKHRDNCQYEVSYNEDWETRGKDDTPSMQIVFAWKNTPKHRFLYRLAKTIYRHGLVMRRVNATYIDPYSKNSTLIMSLGLHGMKGKAAWEEADVDDFMQELVTLKYFNYLDPIEKRLIDPGIISGNCGNLLRSMMNFIHQTLVHVEENLYSFQHIEEGLCRHTELTAKLITLFELKFHPEKHNIESYYAEKDKLIKLVKYLDTGSEINDLRRKNILLQGINFLDHLLKTNFYRHNKSAHSFRLDPKYLDHIPMDRKEKFPELPFGIFFIHGMHFIGFQIRFKDLSRGGLRTVLPKQMEQMVSQRTAVFSECYNLAYTQQKKNKDIPEGGSKAIIFLEPYDRLTSETDIYRKEMKWAGTDPEKINETLKQFIKEQKIEYLYQTQRAFIHSFLTLINCNPDGTLKAKYIVDYLQKPEYIYLGPDENMHNHIIEWISNYSLKCGYLPGTCFISSKPHAGINHKEYGITSFGVNVYMEAILEYLHINPKKEIFTVKISGGPDGDVAGNQILNLYKYYPKTAKLLALIDGSGTIYDPMGLDLKTLSELFYKGLPISHYPKEKLHEGAFLLDTQTKREETAYSQKTLCHKKENGQLIEEWISGNDTHHLLRYTVHQTKADIFIPAGGRPKTLNINNYKEYLDENDKPTSRAIVEGANLYLTPGARTALENLGVLIIKDSSANKGGVICSSLEVLTGLILTEEEFLAEKPKLMEEILAFIKEKALSEAKLLLKIHEETKANLTDISDLISKKINTYTYELLDALEEKELSSDPNDLYIRALLNYCPPLLRKKYTKRIIEKLPGPHKKAIIACYLASKLVYLRGVDWSPSIDDVLPLIANDPSINP